MKKTVYSSAILAAIVSLTFTSMASAHHMSEDVNPNFDFVDDQISDMHIEVIDTMLEDGELMGGMADSTGAEPAMTGTGSSDMAGSATTQVVSMTGTGSSSGGASAGGSSRR
jgi:hypothetical protein